MTDTARAAAKEAATLAYLTEEGLTMSGSFERGFDAGWRARPVPTVEEIAEAMESHYDRWSGPGEEAPTYADLAAAVHALLGGEKP